MTTDAEGFRLGRRGSEIAHQVRDELGCDAVVVIIVKGDEQYMGTCKIDPLGLLRLFSASTSSIISQVQALTLPLIDVGKPKLDG